MKKNLSIFLVFIMLFSLLPFAFILPAKGEALKAFEEQKEKDLALMENFANKLKTTFIEEGLYSSFPHEKPQVVSEEPPTEGNPNYYHISFLNLSAKENYTFTRNNQGFTSNLSIIFEPNGIPPTVPFAISQFISSFASLSKEDGREIFEELFNHLAFSQEIGNLTLKESQIDIGDISFYLLFSSHTPTGRPGNMILFLGTKELIHAAAPYAILTYEDLFMEIDSILFPNESFLLP